MRTLTWLAALLIAACGDAPKLAPLAPDAVVLAFGDSLTYGTGASEADSYPAQLEKLIGRKVVRAGVPGEVTEGGLQRLPAVIEEHRPALMIVCLGGNDMLRKLDEAQTKANLREIIRMIRAGGISVVLVGVPKPALITGTAEFYAEIAKEFNVPYEGKIVSEVLHQRDLKSDSIHPNARGYRKMAEAIAELLRKAGAV